MSPPARLRRISPGDGRPLRGEPTCFEALVGCDAYGNVCVCVCKSIILRMARWPEESPLLLQDFRS